MDKMRSIIGGQLDGYAVNRGKIESGQSLISEKDTVSISANSAKKDEKAIPKYADFLRISSGSSNVEKVEDDSPKLSKISGGLKKLIMGMLTFTTIAGAVAANPAVAQTLSASPDKSQETSQERVVELKGLHSELQRNPELRMGVRSVFELDDKAPLDDAEKLNLKYMLPFENPTFTWDKWEGFMRGTNGVSQNEQAPLPGNISSLDNQELKKAPDPNLGASKVFLNRLNKKADEVFKNRKKYGNLHTSCARTARAIVAKMIETDRGPGGWRDEEFVDYDKSAFGKDVQHLDTMIKEGKLKPGSIIYMNKKPGKDWNSTKLSLKPHWITYLGVNDKGVPEFVDQNGLGARMGHDRTLDAVMKQYKGRKIDTIFFPQEYYEHFGD